MGTRRMLRMMAGEIKTPLERATERAQRKDKRTLQTIKQYMAWGDKISRRQERDPGLPPMPYDFEEQARRAKGDKPHD